MNKSYGTFHLSLKDQSLRPEKSLINFENHCLDQKISNCEAGGGEGELWNKDVVRGGKVRCMSVF